MKKTKSKQTIAAAVVACMALYLLVALALRPLPAHAQTADGAAPNPLVRIDGASTLSDNTCEDGTADGKKITASGQGTVIDYRLKEPVLPREAMLRLRLSDVSLLSGDTYLETYLQRGTSTLAVRLYAGTLGLSSALVLYREGQPPLENSIGPALLLTDSTVNDAGRAVADTVATAFTQTPDIREAGKLNWVAKVNGGSKELRGSADNAPFIDFLQGGAAHVGFRLVTAAESEVSLVVLQAGDDVYYAYERADGSVEQKDGDVGYSKVYVRWQKGRGETGATILNRYDGAGKNLLHQIVFPSVARETYTDTDLKQGTQYCYRIRIVDSATAAVPRLVTAYEDIRITTKLGHIYNILLVVLLAAVVFAAAILLYTFVPGLRAKRKANKKK